MPISMTLMIVVMMMMMVYITEAQAHIHDSMILIMMMIMMMMMVYITEAHAHIHDSNGGDIMVKKGSNIELNCTVESGDRVHHSLAVFWYLDDTVIDWMGQTGSGNGVQVLFTIREDIYIS